MEEQIAVDDLVSYVVGDELRRGTVRAIFQGREDANVGQHYVALIERRVDGSYVPDARMLCRLTKLKVTSRRYVMRRGRLVEVK